jgi:hypothetical protein
VRKIKLSNSDKVVIIDNRDFKKVSKFTWALTSHGYARRGVWVKINGQWKQQKLYLHRLIMRPKKGLEVDHKNRNKLDCRRSNMRIVTKQVNLLNKGMLRNNTSGVKGVWFSKGKWVAGIEINKKKINLGRFDHLKDASIARKEAEKKYHECHLV